VTEVKFQFRKFRFFEYLSLELGFRSRDERNLSMKNIRDSVVNHWEGIVGGLRNIQYWGS
jgi:hypothetical protein